MAFPSFGSTATSQPFSFGSAATTATTKGLGFSNFSFSQPTTTPAFGQTAAPASTGFGLGSGTSTFGTGFGTTPATTTATGFGGFGTATSSAPSTGFGFGTGTTGTSGGSTLFSGFGQQAATTSAGFGSFGSSFGAKPLGTTTGTGTFGGFGTSSAPLFGGGFGQTAQQQQQQQQQQQAPANSYDAIQNAILNCNMFGDERDTTLARWNLLQALWGTGKGYYSPNAPPVEFTQQNPLCRFKAVGYSLKPTCDNKEGLVALCFTKKVADIRPQQNQLVTSLNAVLGNKPNLSINVEGMKPLSDTKAQVVITVQEKGATGSVRKIPATELATYLLQPMQKQQLSQLGVDNVYPQVATDEDQLKDYLENPPSGIDPRLWKQAIQDNPNPSKLIPVPMIGFGEVRWRMKCQEQETALHQAFLDKVAEQVQTLQQRQADTLAKTTEYRRKLVELEHRILKLLVKQEVTRKVGLALQPEEETIRSHLEALQPHLYAPRQLKGRLAELLSTIRMQREKGELKDAERYTMNPAAQDEIKQFLSLQHKGMQVLVQTIRSDLGDLKIIKDGMTKLLHRQ